ncbi:MAG: hypothetical protein IT379_25720 [Deltaproteobacteria bacterium]|nr:hypothetical protein [Deltaproteobacteria bacterium]
MGFRSFFVLVCTCLWSLAACSDSNDRPRDDAGRPPGDGAVPPPPPDGAVPPPPPDGAVPPPPPDGAVPPPPPDAFVPPDVDVPPIAIAHSFDVVARLEPDPSGGGGPMGDLPAEHAFTLRLETVADGLRAILGRSGTVAEVMLAGRGDGTFTYEAPMFGGISVGVDRAPGSCGGAVGAQYERIEIRLESTPGETVGRVVGTASGRISFTGGDVIWDEAFRATLDGPLDTTAPDYRTNVVEEPHHPLDGFVVRTSEPLPRSVGVGLAGIGPLEPVLVEPTAGAAAFFSLPTGTVLPWGTSLSVVFMPGLIDLAGNEATPVPEAPPETLADPGLLAQDGFESAVRLWQMGDVIVVAPGVGSPAPISGTGSLFVGPGDFSGGLGGGRITARLAIPAGGTRLRARFRTLGEFPGSGFWNSIRLAAPNARVVERVSLPPSAGGAAPSGLARLPYASEVLELDVPLPAGASGEVLLDIDNRLGCGGLPPPPTGILLDDLRIE